MPFLGTLLLFDGNTFRYLFFSRRPFVFWKQLAAHFVSLQLSLKDITEGEADVHATKQTKLRGRLFTNRVLSRKLYCLKT